MCLPDHAQILEPVIGRTVEKFVFFAIAIVEAGKSAMLTINGVEAAVGVALVNGD